MTSPGSVGVSLVEADAAAMTAVEPEWRALERAAGAAPYLCWDWLAAWRSVYAPSHAAIVRIGPADGGAPVALGMVERRAGGRWRFAGAPVSPTRGLLARPEDRARAWVALSTMLGDRAGDWRTLIVEGVDAAAAVLPGSRLVCSPTWVIAPLPDSFDAYLGQRSQNQRKAHKQKLRRIAAADGEVALVDPAEHEAALQAFLRLHRWRAAAKGERHPQIDHRLGAMLAAVGDSAAVRLRVFALRIAGELAGVSVRLDRDEHGAAWFYNAGIDPGHGRLGPGIVLEISSIRDAIERGHRSFDLGPGWWRYKHDLGGVEHSAYDGAAVSPTMSSSALRMATVSITELYARAPGRSVLRRVRREATSSGRSTAG